MKSCTFFGHRDIYEQIEENLTSVIINLIENDVGIFYVGSQGCFDFTVIKILKSLKIKYPHITYYVVLAYLPLNKNYFNINYEEDTLYPEGLESVPPKYAIVKRNKWMIQKSDYVIVYVTHSFGNAAKFKAYSEKNGKIVINIANYINSD